MLCTFLVNSSRIRVSNIELFTSLKDGITSPCMCRLKVLAWKCSRMRKIGRHMNAWRGMNLKKNINTGIEHQIGKHSKKILLVVYNSVIYGVFNSVTLFKLYIIIPENLILTQKLFFIIFISRHRGWICCPRYGHKGT